MPTPEGRGRSGRPPREGSLIVSEAEPEDPTDIMADVCARKGLTMDELKFLRLQLGVSARRECAHRMRATGLSLQSIGFLLGGYDHTTVLNLLKVKK